MSDGAMTELFDSRPILCVDILFIDTASKTVLLPQRVLKPAEGLWFVGGMIKRNNPPEQAAAKVVAHHTGAMAKSEQLQFLTASWFEWDYRADAPSENGRVDFNLCYTYRPNAEEKAAIAASLIPDDPRKPEEYDRAHGLQAYNREQLVQAIKDDSPAKQVLVDYFDMIFPAS